MKRIFLALFLTSVLFINLNAQDNKPILKNTTSEIAPVVNRPDGLGNNNVLAYGSRWFGQNAAATSFFTKGFLNNTGALTNFGSSSTSLYGAMEFDNTGTLYCIAVASNSPLQTLDTTTGTLTTLGAITGVGTEQILGMSFNPVNSTMYLTTIATGSTDKLYTLNLSTRVATLIGATTQNLFDIGINSLGQCYGVSVVDNLVSINLTTGIGTVVGPIGFDANFIQGLSFDRSTDTLWYAAYNQTAGSGQLRTVNLTTGATTLIASFTGAAEVCGFAIPGRRAFPLSAFNLQTPPAGARIVTVTGSTTPVTITWDTSASGANYKFIFGNPLPTRRFTIPSPTNTITTTLGALDAILAANGFTNNGTATDSAVGNWDVWAFKAAGVTGPDSLKATNGPRAITFRRQQVALSPFALVSPASGITVNTSPVNLTPITFTWRSSGLGATYRWLYKTGATYTDPATLRINTGIDTFWTVRISRLDSILAGVGVNPGDSVTGQWRARSYNATDSLNSTAPDRAITFRRAGLLPLAQNFTDAAFPPPFWSIEGTGTIYWTRQAGLGSYGGTTGSAKFDFWTAASGVTQSLVSNQFPPVTAPFRNLGFDWTQAFYMAGATPARDSLIIHASTDAGVTYTRLIGYGANNQVFTSLSTTLSQSQYIPPLILPTHWGTKKIVLPLGTNRVKFEAKSDFGNNLFIDSVRLSDNLVNINIPLTLAPEKYNLDQNYPNPFNPVTTISFSTPKQGFVTLKVYNVLGKEIATLVNEVRPAGFYNINFDATNFASGVYFYKIETGDFSDIKRMMLIK